MTKRVRGDLRDGELALNGERVAGEVFPVDHLVTREKGLAVVFFGQVNAKAGDHVSIPEHGVQSISHSALFGSRRVFFLKPGRSAAWH